ncbi:tagaturonate reductase [Paenibacillus sp. URB8-2]|uniref:tagaturonate reductase n=1 Tax=Paenibacillus sp. URB8-2 TaxID=2741301 RepID=UPI0015BB4E6E|nr:tagaturonate reductase [Paenibacillus sp. URB8-2]BCG58289.1 altronate oxidoreductase [Paenibacillus sp. URB8-2]
MNLANNIPLLSRQLIAGEPEPAVNEESFVPGEQSVNEELSVPGDPPDGRERLQRDPVTILQIGEGNFLRGFFDWMLQTVRRKGLYSGTVAVTQPRPGGRAKLESLKRQDGLYTLVSRGLEKGQPVESREVISVFSSIIDPYEEWNRFLELAENPDLRFVVSNTTEAGITYREEKWVEGEAVVSFPGKMALFLLRRYTSFGGAPDKGLIFLPCELLSNNGDELRRCILRYCEAWGLPSALKEWITRSNCFLNTLVDRIVSGYPKDEAAAWTARLGYQDELLTVAEPYYSWIIETDGLVEDIIPFQKAGLHVRYVEDLQSYRLRKVRMLNGAHTLMAPLGILHGVQYVREAFEHDQFGPLVRHALEEEILPSLSMDREELMEYAGSLYERFRNPYIAHRLSDIAMNTISKFRERLLPSLLYYSEHGREVPPLLTRSFAALLRYYKIRKSADGYEGTDLNGVAYLVQDEAAVLDSMHQVWKKADDRTASAKEKNFAAETNFATDANSAIEMASALLGMKGLWGTDLSTITGLSEAIAAHWREMEMTGYE